MTNGLKGATFKKFMGIHLSTLLGVKHMRKSIYQIFLITVFLLINGNLYAVDLKDGFFDIQWKTDLSQVEGFKKVGENLNVIYFISPKRVFTINDIRIPDVVYASYADQFFAVYINVDTIEVFAQVRRHMSRNYGVPRISKRMPAEQTTFQWKHEKTKIKLKTYETRNNMKMAFYYTPLSRMVNESQQEAFHENFSRRRFPLDDRRMQQAMNVMEFEGLGPR